MAEYQLRGKEASVMMEYAKEYQSIQEDEGVFSSPFLAVKNTTTTQYNEILKKYFKPEQRYEYLYKAPILFAYDYVLFSALALILTFTGLRFVLTKEFKNDHIRWVRKVKYPPLKLLEMTALVFGFFIFVHIEYLVTKTVGNSNFFQSHLILSQYLLPALAMSGIVMTFQITLSALPKKLMVMDDQLIIKSISYYSKKFPLNEIESIEISKTLFYPFPISKWIRKVGFRYFNFSMKFWKPGLLINMKNGKAYFFSIESAKDAQRELVQFIPESKLNPVDHNIAA